MSTPKILIAYDGSSYANAALADLRHAGLPAEVEAVVLAVADVWLPPANATGEEVLPEIEPPIIVKARRHAVDALTEMHHHAEYAGHQLQQFFPSWQIQTESVTDSPGWGHCQKSRSMAGRPGGGGCAGSLSAGSGFARQCFPDGDDACTLFRARGA